MKHRIKNKLKYALRHSKIWHTKIIPDKKKQAKKTGEYHEKQ